MREKDDGAFAIPATEVHGKQRGFSTVEYAAIHLRVEHPDLPSWLNEMIRKSRRDEFAKAATAGYAVDETEALKFADAEYEKDRAVLGGSHEET